MYDLLIKNGTILNGTGSPSFYGDIGILEGKIARIGKGLEGAKTVIDATGLTVTPGFIDSHSHSDNAVLEFPELLEKIEQGITTSAAARLLPSAGTQTPPPPLRWLALAKPPTFTPPPEPFWMP